MSLSGEVVLIDPAHPYGAEFIGLFRRRWGMRTVCVWTDADQRRTQAWRFPALRSDAVAAHYDLGSASLDDLAAHLRRSHSVKAVVPYLEPIVPASERLAELLGFDWAQPDVVPLFRDKYALKAHLRDRPGGPRVNYVAAVRSPADVHLALEGTDVARFVLKPNDGYGNSRIGFFDRDGDPAAVDAYFSATAGTAILLEEFVGGQEYYVNGQTDGAGRVEVVDVSLHRRRAVNGRENVAIGSLLVPRHDPMFDLLATYASEVVTAAGLRRSPFHLELKVDDQGPCLIEVGARLVGGSRAYDEIHIHGGGFDPFAVAAHYYLTGDDYGDLGLDWHRYDAKVFGHANGLATAAERIMHLEGVEKVQSTPGFVRWITKPRVGDKVVPTIDIFALPWHLTFEADSVDDFDATAEQMRSTIRWNADLGPAARAAGKVRAAVPPARRRLQRWYYRRSVRPAATLGEPGVRQA